MRRSTGPARSSHYRQACEYRLTEWRSSRRAHPSRCRGGRSGCNRPSSLRELAGHFLVCAPSKVAIERQDYLRTPKLNGAVPIVGALGAGALLTRGPVLLQVGTAFVVPTDGQ